MEKGKSQFAGPEILGKTLGVVGLGAIGTLVANCANALGMRVIAYVHRNPEEKKEKLAGGIEVTTDLDEVLAQSDYLSLHAPLNDSTRGMINRHSLEKAKDGVRILNFARAQLVENLDLIEALESGKAAAYATDFPTDEQLCTPGVIAIPHLGASTPESEDNCASMAAQEIRDYLETGSIRNSVNFPNLVQAPSAAFRICVLHKNTQGVVSSISTAIAGAGINIESMASASRKDAAYMIIDVNVKPDDAVMHQLNAMDGVYRARVISF